MQKFIYKPVQQAVNPPASIQIKVDREIKWVSLLYKVSLPSENMGRFSIEKG